MKKLALLAVVLASLFTTYSVFAATSLDCTASGTVSGIRAISISNRTLSVNGSEPAQAAVSPQLAVGQRVLLKTDHPYGRTDSVFGTYFTYLVKTTQTAYQIQSFFQCNTYYQEETCWSDEEQANGSDAQVSCVLR